MDKKQAFIAFYNNSLQSSPLWQKMAETTEGSPWHREKTVLIHTNMVVSHYISQTSVDWDHSDVLGAFAVAFHDVGKPSAEEIVHSEERGEYRRYHGHEQISQRLWENWAVENCQILCDIFDFEPIDIYKVGWIIQMHLPYGIKKPQKRRNLYTSALLLFGRVDVFVNCLRADNWGRISDDHPQKRRDAEEWIDNFKTIEPHDVKHFTTDAPVLYILIGASGSGKSSFSPKGVGQIHSMDALRLELYGDQTETDKKTRYAQAFEQSCEDADFSAKVQADFIKKSKSNERVVYVDNTNLSTKRRAMYIQAARQHGRQVVAVLFPINKQELKSRITSRNDKFVPVGAVMRQYDSLQLPSIGEVDHVMSLGHNIQYDEHGLLHIEDIADLVVV